MRRKEIRIHYTTTKGDFTYILTSTERVLQLSSENITSIRFPLIPNWFKLKHINLSDNQIEFINLDPVCSLKSLEIVNLGNNPLKYVDATPLFFCDNLFDYQVNKGVPGFVSPLARFARANIAFISHLNSIGLAYSFDDIVADFGWKRTLSSIKTVLGRIQQLYWFAAQRGLLAGLGMAEIAAYDGKPLNLLKGVTQSKSFEESKDIIYDNAIRLLETQVENNGSTHFLNIDELAMTRAAGLVKNVIEARRREMEEITVEVVGGKADARVFWFTFYGKRILEELGYVPFAWNTVRLHDVVVGLERAGFPPKIIERNRPSKNTQRNQISEGLAHQLQLLGAGHNLVQDGITSQPWFVK
ncbi:MAG: leucine-rich repeat domain-containing protein [Candidatus Thorarchaeota archaeon]